MLPPWNTDDTRDEDWANPVYASSFIRKDGEDRFSTVELTIVPPCTRRVSAGDSRGDKSTMR
jgi:hypothetical protein